jgi:hypothetical protein
LSNPLVKKKRKSAKQNEKGEKTFKNMKAVSWLESNERKIVRLDSCQFCMEMKCSRIPQIIWQNDCYKNSRSFFTFILKSSSTNPIFSIQKTSGIFCKEKEEYEKHNKKPFPFSVFNLN